MEDLQFYEDSSKKKILFMAKFFFPPLGGGEYFLLSVLQYLQTKGYYCEAVCWADGASNGQHFPMENKTDWGGIPVRQEVIRSSRDVDSVVREINPDLIITQSNDALAIVLAAKKIGAKSILGTHFWRNICEVDKVFKEMMTRPSFSVRKLTQCHPVFELADEYYVNSKFMQLGVEKYVGKKIDRIIHPILDEKRIAIKEHKPKYITMINPDLYKGGSLFLEIAKHMPRNEFLCVGKAPEENSPEHQKINSMMKSSQNIKVIDKTDNMSSVYSETSILLVPSIVDETFSMVALEAMWNGIPVVVSNAGNLPYLVEQSSIVLSLDDVEIWVQMIKELLSDKDFYATVATEVKERAREFSPKNELSKFEEMVKETIGGPKID